MLRGKNQEATPKVEGGDIVAVAKLNTTVTGDKTSTAQDKQSTDSIAFPKPE
jgi:translation elongation factor EF-G